MRKDETFIRRTFTIRVDQDRALAISLALGTNKHGRDKSAVIRALLDANGYRDIAERQAPPTEP